MALKFGLDVSFDNMWGLNGIWERAGDVGTRLI
jgi:hypothetical protein